MSNISITKNYDLQVKSKISEYLNPDFCYIPIVINGKLLVNINDRVLKNQPIIESDEGYIISSPISGVPISIESINTIHGVTSALVIKNDFKEKNFISKGVNTDFTKYNNFNLNNLMKSCGVSYFDDKNDFFSFSNKKPKYLLINSVEDEPYIANFSIMLKIRLEEILESADDISRLLGIDKIYVAISDDETDVIADLIDMLGTFPNFELILISNTYPVNLYKALPASINDNEVLYLNLSTLKAINVALKKERNVTSKLITVTGDLVTEPKVISVKIGSSLDYVINNNFKIKKSNNPVYIVNGLLNGLQVDNLNMIITPDLKSIMIMESVSYEEKDCLNCGACIRVCPDKMNVKYIVDNINNKKNNKIINEPTNFSPCSYICPANKNFFSIFSKDNRKNNKVIIHNDNSISKINYRYLLALLPLILFGFYKNGIIVYQNNLASLLELFYPLIIPIGCLIIGYFVSYIINKTHHKKTGKILENYNMPILTLIIGMLMPINVNIFICFGILLIFSIVYFRYFYRSKLSINFIAISTLTIVVASALISNTMLTTKMYMNNYEAIANLNPSIIRLVFGYNYSGLATSNLFLILFAYVFLSFSISYKKEIPFYTLLFYLILLLISLLFFADFNPFIRNMFSSSFLFIVVFVASEMKSSPYNRLGMIIYSLLIALVSFALAFVNFEISLLLSIFLISTITNLINKVFRKTKF